MSGPVLVVALLATYRLSLLWTHDTITERPVTAVWAALQRRKFPDADPAAAGPNYPQAQDAVLVSRAQRPHRLVKLTECPWCGSFWYALVLVMPTAWAWGDRWWWFIPAGALAASAVSGILTDLSHPEGRKEPEPPRS